MRSRLPTLLAILVPLLALAPAEPAQPTQWALLIGITDYIHFGDEEGGDLPGAEQDARRMRDVLVTRGYVPEANARLLLNQDATRAGIEDAVSGWLADRARPGDNVLVFFAGHGSQKWDENEEDGLDETLAPADALPDRTDFDITGQDLERWFEGLATDNVVVILDSCHSGTATRDVTPFSRARTLARDLASVPRPPGMATRAVGEVPASVSGFDAGRRVVLELAAAQPDQAAVEVLFPGEAGGEAFQGGAFTTHLVRELWRAPEGATYQEVFGRATESMKRNRFQQDPMLSGAPDLIDSPLFHVEGGADATTGSGLPVLGVEGARVELAGGVAMGITAGSVLETTDGVRLEVEESREQTIVARASGGTPRVGDNARLASFRYPTSPLLVNVAAIGTDLARAVEGALAGHEGVVVVDDPDAFSHLLVRRSGEHLRIVGTDGFVRHDRLSAAAGDLAAVAAALRREAAAKRLGDMENPGQRFDVRLSMSEGESSFGIGEEISFRVRSERDGYLTLVDLGTDGTVAVLIPNAETPSLRVSGGRELVYPSEEGVYFEALPPAGGGLVRAFVTDAPLDIRIPDGETYAYGDEDFAAAVVASLLRAVGEEGGAVSLESWGTASLVYQIRN